MVHSNRLLLRTPRLCRDPRLWTKLAAEDSLLFACSLDRRKQIVERFGQRRVGEVSVPKSHIGYLAEHGNLDHRGYLAAFYPQDRAAQDLIGIGVHHGLHHASTLVHLQRSSHVAHRHLGDANVTTLIAGLPFAQPYTT